MISKIKLLSISCVLLLLINIYLLVQLFNHKASMDKEGPKQKIIEQLKLDKAQQRQYEDLITTHRVGIDKQHKLLKTFKKELYIGLMEPKIAEHTDSLINEIAKLHMQIEHINIQHFVAIKKICKPNQITLYNEFCTQIADLFTKPKNEDSD